MKRKQKKPMLNNSEMIMERILNHNPSFSNGESRITIDLDKGMLIEGVKQIREYGSEQLIISTYGKNLIIEGCGLCLGCIMHDSIVICGRITCVKLI